jgi:formylglycine-generating enzyme required for sulfatase activity
MAERSIAVVVAVAAATGVVLARGAGASGERTPRGAALVSAAPPPGGGAAPAAGAPVHDESEHEEPHGGPSENPYDEPSPARTAPVRQPVPSQGGMLRLPGGRFVMGSANPRAPLNERPARSASVPPFWIDRTEVTVGAYRACVEAGACAPPARASATCTFDAGDADLPVSCVHWRDADAYCRHAGKRLPNEREWEFAARGTFATSFPWGWGAGCTSAVTLINDQTGKTCAPRPAKVGSHPAGASVFGVLDLSGNVEEWTADWYVEALGPGPAPRAGAAHVLRGGGWLSPPSMSRTTSRNWGSALEAGPNVGFRCAKDAE